MKRMLFVPKARARKLLISKEPSVKMQMVFSDYTKRRILVRTSTSGKLSSDHFEVSAKRRNKSELTREFKVFTKVRTNKTAQ